MSSTATAPSAEKPIVLRPLSAFILPVLVWAVCAFLVADAARLGDWATILTTLSGIAFIAILMWAVVFSPRTLVYRDRVEILNVFTRHVAPYSAIERVSIGAMVSIYVLKESGKVRRIIAWNAPGAGRDKPGALFSRGHHAAGSTPAHGHSNAPAHVGPATRLRVDQQRSQSYVLQQRFEQWHDAHKASGMSHEGLRSRARWVPILLVVASATWLVLSLAL